MRVTLHDIAREAGVSVGAVSQVLNNHPNAKTLREETRRKIMDTVKRMNYSRNQSAIETRTGIVKTVALVCKSPGKSMETDNMILLGVIQAASASGYGVKVFPPMHREQVFESILAYGLEKIICLTLDDMVREEFQKFSTQHEFQLCFVLERAHGNYPVVVSKDREAMRNVVRTFVGMGHRRIALINAGNNSLFRYKEERGAGYFEGMKEAGLTVDPGWISDSPDPEVSVRDIAKMLRLPEKRRPTAFCCISDFLAACVVNTAVRLGLRVPDDVSVFGYGDTTLTKAAFVPLSSVHEDFEKIGEEAFRILYENRGFKRNNEEESYILLPTELILRESVRKRKQERRRKNEE